MEFVIEFKSYEMLVCLQEVLSITSEILILSPFLNRREFQIECTCVGNNFELYYLQISLNDTSIVNSLNSSGSTVARSLAMTNAPNVPWKFPIMSLEEADALEDFLRFKCTAQQRMNLVIKLINLCTL